jgi:hypothetical protein
MLPVGERRDHRGPVSSSLSAGEDLADVAHGSGHVVVLLPPRESLGAERFHGSVPARRAMTHPAKY